MYIRAAIIGMSKDVPFPISHQYRLDPSLSGRWVRHADASDALTSRHISVNNWLGRQGLYVESGMGSKKGEHVGRERYGSAGGSRTVTNVVFLT